jgi:hypothetical protein
VLIWLPKDYVGVDDESSRLLRTVRGMAGLRMCSTGVGAGCWRGRSRVSWKSREEGGGSCGDPLVRWERVCERAAAWGSGVWLWPGAL